MKKIICMSFDGEYQKERPTFDTTEAAWEYSNDLGSKWYFYPFHFVTTDSYKTIVSAPELLAALEGRRVKTVSNIFKKISERDDMQNADPEQFAIAVYSLTD